MNVRLQRLGIIAWKELRQLRRDRLTLGMMLVLPMVQLLLFGYAINTDVRHLHTVVFDQDRGAEGRDLARRMEATGFYDLSGEVGSYDEIGRAFREGRAHVALVVPPHFSADVAAHRPTTVQLVVDASDAQTVGSATSTAAGVVADRSAAVLGGRPPITVEATAWYNPDLRTAVYIVPGLIGVILTMTLVMLTAMAIVRERERGTLEQLIVSPIGRAELMLGKILPYVGIGFAQMTLILLLGWLVFGVPFAGSIALLYCLALLFIAGNLAVGLVFSTIARSQLQAMQMSFFFVLPNILLSGFMFPRAGMPRPLRMLSEILPLTHFLQIVRGIILKGAGFFELADQLAWLAAIFVVLVTIASLRFRKTLD